MTKDTRKLEGLPGGTRASQLMGKREFAGYLGGLASVLLFGCSSDSSTPSNSAGKELSPCQTDSDCGPNLGCDPQAAGVGDGYCTPLCNEPTDCDHQTSCPSMVNKGGDCKDQGNHKGMGYCDQYTGNNGPHTCAKAGGNGGSGGTSAGGSGGTSEGGSGGGGCTSCAGSCSGACSSGCSGKCSGGCSGGCQSTCTGCSGFCEGSCTGMTS